MYIGDYIYDEFIRTTNKPTVSNVTIRYILSINKALLFYFYYKGIFSSSKYEYVFTSHYCYIRYGMIARIASKYGIKPIYYESFCDNGGFKLVKLYLKDDLNKVVNRINTTFVNSYSKDLMILKKSKKYFNGVMKGDVELLSDFHNFNNSRVSSNSTKRSDITKLRGDSKIIVISAHCLVDNITGINGRQTVYRDFYTWLIETLKQCDKNTNITTFLKIHPMEKEYTYKPKVIDVFKSVPLKNVFLWPDDLDLKENNDLIDVVLTVAGSVAIEFPCFGVPVIAASINTIPTSSYYEGIVEVRDKGEYIDIIKKIHTIEKIDQNNKDISMLNYYFFYGSMWYFIDKKYYPTADDTIQSEYLKDRSFNYTNPTPVRRDSFSVIKNKLKLFDAEYGKKYESDLDEFFSNKDIRKLSEVRFFREQSFELKE